MRVDIGGAARPKPGERECGDRVIVVDEEATELLVAVVDGLGHGPRAAEAAAATERFLQAHARLDLVELFRRCDRAIADTRGVAMTVLRFDRAARRLQHAAVGNVEMTSLSQQRIRPVPNRGVVGKRVPRVHATAFEVADGDVFAIFSDGISSRLELEPYQGMDAQEAADAILHEHAKEHDDASCAILRC